MHVSVSAGDEFITLHEEVVEEVNLPSPGCDATKHDIIIQDTHGVKEAIAVTRPTEEHCVI